MQHNHPELEQCLLNPSLCFQHPKEVLDTPAFNTAEKIKILQQWELDVRERLVADDENMPDRADNGADFGALLSDIMRAVESLSPEADEQTDN